MQGAKILSPTLFNRASDGCLYELADWLGVDTDELREHFVSSRFVYETTQPKKRNPSQFRVTAVINVHQRRINRIVKIRLNELPVDDAVHGYVRGRSIWSNLAAHLRSDPAQPLAWYGFDIADAFPSVSHRWVLRLLHSSFPELSRGALGLLLNLVMYRPRLDQGYPTSPTLFNLSLKQLDEELRAYCAEDGIVYTRYADDFTFSNTQNFTEEQKRRLQGIAAGKPYRLRVVKQKESHLGEYFEVTHRSILRFRRRVLRDAKRGLSLPESVTSLEQGCD